MGGYHRIFAGHPPQQPRQYGEKRCQIEYDHDDAGAIHPGAVDKSGQGAEKCHPAHVCPRFDPTDNGGNNQDALQAKLRVGHEIRKQGSAMHTKAEEHLRDWHLHQGGKVHENAENHAGDIAKQGVLPCQRLDPLRPDDDADHAHSEHTGHQQRENLFDELPGFPQEIAGFIFCQFCLEDPVKDAERN